MISIDEEPVQIKDSYGNLMPVPGSVKFDTGNDGGTAISCDLVQKLDLELDDSKKKKCVTGPGGMALLCSRVEIKIMIRKKKFKVKALVGATAIGTDLLVGMDIIKHLNDENFTLGN